MDFSKSSGLYYSQPRDVGVRTTTIDTMQVDLRKMNLLRIGNCKSCDQKTESCSSE